jgi:hypothetical protein
VTRQVGSVRADSMASQMDLNSTVIFSH